MVIACFSEVYRKMTKLQTSRREKIFKTKYRPLESGYYEDFQTFIKKLYGRNLNS